MSDHSTPQDGERWEKESELDLEAELEKDLDAVISDHSAPQDAERVEAESQLDLEAGLEEDPMGTASQPEEEVDLSSLFREDDAEEPEKDGEENNAGSPEPHGTEQAPVVITTNDEDPSLEATADRNIEENAESDNEPEDEAPREKDTGIRYSYKYHSLPRSLPNSYDDLEDYLRDIGHLERELHEALARPINANKLPVANSQREIVKTLFTAMVNLNDVIDRPIKGGNPPRSVNPLLKNKYSAEMLEKKSWAVFLECLASQCGLQRLPDLWRKGRGPKQQCDNLTERLQLAYNTLYQSKAAVKSLMEPSFETRIGAAPGAEFKRKEETVKGNDQRNLQYSLGLNAIAAAMGNPTVIDTMALSEEKREHMKRVIEKRKETDSTNTGRRKRKRNPDNSGTPTKAAKTSRSASSRSIQISDDEDYGPAPSRINSLSPPPFSIPALNLARSSGPNHPSSATTPNDARYPPEALSSNSFPPNPFGAPAPVSTSFTGAPPPPPPSDAIPNPAAPIPVGSPLPHDTPDEAAKKVICTLLGINWSFSETFNLEQLRFYARRMNVRYWDTDMLDGDGSGVPRLFHNHGTEMGDGTENWAYHFAQLDHFQQYRPIAFARGEFDQNLNFTWALLSEDEMRSRGMSVEEQREHILFVEQGERGIQIDTAANAEYNQTDLDQILGDIPNPFGQMLYTST